MANRIIRSNSNHSMVNLHTVNHNTHSPSTHSNRSTGNLHMANHSPSTGNRSMLSLNIHSSRSTRHRVISPSQ
jgi:hypothetical protein